VIFTKANADSGGRAINRLIDEYAEKRPDHSLAVDSLGAQRYLSALQYATAVIGNSSSGIMEAPSFNIPTINIGDRQKGRVKAQSVMDCQPSVRSIASCIRRALSPGFRRGLKSVKNPYEQPGTAAAIVKTISLFRHAELIKKSFYQPGRQVRK
jgi:GDP/UDP-N,N'-diacetylbacillosamine 2-epimerase (hydrolysing)